MARKHQKIRLALATTELAVGGAERCLTNLALGLDPRRFEPQVYSLAPPPDKGRSELVTHLDAAGIPIQFVGVKSSYRFIRAARRLRQLLLSQTPDILQTFLFHANVAGTIAGNQAGVPAIVTGIRVADPCRWRWYAERFLTRSAQKVVCVSESVADFARQKLRLPSEKLIVIPNAVDLNRLDKSQGADLSQFKIPDASQVVVAVGRLDPQKGLDWLFQVLPSVFEKLPNCHLLLVGDGPQREALECQAARLDLSLRIHFAGWRPDVANILRSCQMLVLPSRWEGMPNALIEAMAAGLPVVATLADGVQEVLGPLADQQGVRLGDADRLVAKVLRIIGDPKLAEELGRQNRERIAECFSLERMISSYQRFYESLV